jgi:putative membrane protein
MNDIPDTNQLAEERTLLAIERTFSAWIRTGLAALGGGLAIDRLITFKTEVNRLLAYTVGQTLIVWGMLIFIFAALDYRISYRKLGFGRTYKSSWWGLLVTIIPPILVGMLLIIITISHRIA